MTVRQQVYVSHKKAKQIQERERKNKDGSKLSKAIGKHTAFQELDHKQVELKRGSTGKVRQLWKRDIMLDGKEKARKMSAKREKSRRGERWPLECQAIELILSYSFIVNTVLG